MPVHIQLVDFEGRPMPEAALTLTLMTQDGKDQRFRPLVTGPDGSVTLSDPPDGLLAAFASHRSSFSVDYRGHESGPHPLGRLQKSGPGITALRLRVPDLLSTVSRAKSRPKDNRHCFTGKGQRYWQMRASGFNPVIENGRDGYHLRLRTEREVLEATNADDFVVQNGGMSSPKETSMPPGFYFRFFRSRGGQWAGNWWIHYEHYTTIRSYAQDLDISLAAAARRCLVIPDEWGDCGRLVRAELQVRAKAYVGKGKPATGSVSPDNAKRDKSSQRVHMAPQHLELKQWFVPGDRDLIAQMFNAGTPLNVLQKGASM